MPGMIAGPVGYAARMALPPPAPTVHPQQPTVSAPAPNIYQQPIFSKPDSWQPQGPVTTAAGPLARSVPIASRPILPSPEELAPDLFHGCILNQPGSAAAASPTVQQNIGAGANTGALNYQYAANGPVSYNQYQYPPGNFYPYAQQQQAYPTNPYSRYANLEQGPPQQQPGAQPLDAPKENEPKPDAKPPAADKPAKQEEMAAPPMSRMEQENAKRKLVNELNESLESESLEVRELAARKLAKIMAGTANDKPDPQDLVDLTIKVLKDPNSLPRQPVLLALQLGYLAPTHKLIQRLLDLKKEKGLYGFEPGIIDQTLATLKQKEIEGRQKGNTDKNAYLAMTNASRKGAPASVAQPALPEPQALPAAAGLSPEALAALGPNPAPTAPGQLPGSMPSPEALQAFLAQNPAAAQALAAQLGSPEAMQALATMKPPMLPGGGGPPNMAGMQSPPLNGFAPPKQAWQGQGGWTPNTMMGIPNGFANNGNGMMALPNASGQNMAFSDPNRRFNTAAAR